MAQAEPNVEYTVKELLDRIDRRVESIDGKLDLKADRERVHDLTNRVATLELLNAGQVPMLQQFSDSRKDIEDLKLWRNRLVGAVGLAVFIGGAAFARAVGVG